MFREWEKVYIWDWYRDVKDSIIKLDDGRLFLKIHEDVEVNKKNIEDYNIRIAFFVDQEKKDKAMMDFFNTKW